MSKRIAFIRPKAWPLANRIVEGVIQEQFPHHEMDIFDLSSLVRKRPEIILFNCIATILLYGKDIIQGKKKFRLAFWRTPFIFHWTRRLMQKRLQPEIIPFPSRCNRCSTRVRPISRISFTPSTPI